MTEAKLTESQLKKFRAMLLAKQDGMCSLCDQYMVVRYQF